MATIANPKTNVLGTQKMVRLLFTLAITLSAVNQVNQSSIYLYPSSYNACIFSLASDVVQSVCSFVVETEGGCQELDSHWCVFYMLRVVLGWRVGHDVGAPIHCFLCQSLNSQA